jgi:hypothetical protein
LVIQVKVRVSYRDILRITVVLVNGGTKSDGSVIVLRPIDIEFLSIPLDNFDVIVVELVSERKHNLIESKG